MSKYTSEDIGFYHVAGWHKTNREFTISLAFGPGKYYWKMQPLLSELTAGHVYLDVNYRSGKTFKHSLRPHDVTDIPRDVVEVLNKEIVLPARSKAMLLRAAGTDRVAICEFLCEARNEVKQLCDEYRAKKKAEQKTKQEEAIHKMREAFGIEF